MAVERRNSGDVILSDRFMQAIARLKPGDSGDVLDEAARKALHPDSPSRVINNHAFHRMLTEGIEVEYRRADGSMR